jgi:hypothetical protein
MCCSSIYDAYGQVDDNGSELDKKHRFEDEAVEESGSDASDEDGDDEDEEDNAEDEAVEEGGSDASDEDGDDEDEEDDADSCADDAVAEACAALRNRRSFKVIVWRIEWQLRGMPHFHYAVYFIHTNVTGCIGISK